MSGQLKNEIRARYIEYVVLYAIFAWPICLATKPNYRYLAPFRSYVGGTVWIGADDFINYFYALTLLSGALIALSRMRDRLLRQKLSNVFYRTTCQKHKKTSLTHNEATLNTFLTTSLNTELVITILKGINVIAASSSDSIDNMSESDMLLVGQEAEIEID